MSNNDLEKNFALSAKFNEYIADNPLIMKGVPNTAHIVFIPKNNTELTKKNTKMAKEIARKQKKSVFGAFEEDGKWKVEKLAFAK